MEYHNLQKSQLIDLLGDADLLGQSWIGVEINIIAYQFETRKLEGKKSLSAGIKKKIINSVNDILSNKIIFIYQINTFFLIKNTFGIHT